MLVLFASGAAYRQAEEEGVEARGEQGVLRGRRFYQEEPEVREVRLVFDCSGSLLLT